MKKLVLFLKPYLRWVIVGGTLFFLGTALHRNWQDVASIRLSSRAWFDLMVAFLLTLTAHSWAGFVWSWILRSFQQPVRLRWVLQVYLKTNLAKYLPGNVWHFYGRIRAVANHGGSLGVASLTVLLEPLLMAAAALLVALLGSFGQFSPQVQMLQILGLVGVLTGIHPRFLNPVIRKLEKNKLERQKSQPPNPDGEAIAPVRLNHYPLRILLGEVGFILVRSLGFWFILQALTPLTLAQLPLFLSAFSLAWVLGLLIPGAPGGLGVFEATAIALLGHLFPSAILLSAVALFRVISIFAEVLAAAIAVLSEQFSPNVISS